MISTFSSNRMVATAFAAAAISVGVIAWSPPAEARFGGFHGGGGMAFHGDGSGFHGGGMAFRGGGVRMGGFGSGGFARPGFARPAFVGPGFVRPGFVRPGFAQRAVFFHNQRFHHNRFFFAPAFAYGLGAPYYYNNYYGDDCYYVWRRRFDPWGYVVTRRVLVCP